jgi:cytoskeletal protein RodZ
VTGYGPPDDPSEAPTGQYNYSDYGDDGQQQLEPGSTPWHRKPAVLVGLGVVVAILIALVIFGIVELTRGGSGSTSPATSSTTPAAVTTTTTPPPSEPAAPAPTTTLTTAPTTTAPATTAPTSTAPTSTSIDDGRHHHHHHADGGMP